MVQSSSHSTITNNTCSDITQDGIYLSRSSHCTLMNNTITENQVGIYLKSSSRENIAFNNSIFNNTDYGIDASDNDGHSIDAPYNWWGAASGPYHPSRNPEGEGDSITDYVILGMPTAYIDSISPNVALNTDWISFKGHGTDDGTVERFVWRSSLDGEVHNNTESDFTTEQLSVGEHIVYLRVQDNYGFWSPEVNETLIVTEKPVASIQSISPNLATPSEIVSFVGHGPMTAQLNVFSWRSTIAGELHNDTISDFDMDELGVGEHTIFFKVLDIHGFWSDEDSETLVVTERPVASIDTVIPESALEGEAVLFEGNGTDDGSIERYVWSSSINGEIYSGPHTNFTYSDLSNGTHTIYLEVQDDHDVWSDKVSVTLTVNGIPRARIVSISHTLAEEKENISFLGRGTDDGTIERFVWRSSIDEEIYNGTNTSFFFSNLSNGTHSIYFKVQDDSGIWSEEVTADLTINGIPRAHIDSIPPNPAEEGEIITFNGSGTDDGFIVTYSWRSSYDPGLYNGSNSSFTLSNLTTGNLTIYLKVKDDYGVWSTEVSIILAIIPPTIQEDTSPPSLTISSPKDDEKVKGNIIISGTASDNVGIMKVEYLLKDSEGWLQAKGTTSWTVELDTTQFGDGDHTFQFRAYDERQSSEIQSLTIEVDNEDNSEDGNEDDNFLFEQIGPLPLIGYLGIVIVVVLLVITRAKKRKKEKKKGRSEGGMSAGATSSPSPTQPQLSIPSPIRTSGSSPLPVQPNSLQPAQQPIQPSLYSPPQSQQQAQIQPLSSGFPLTQPHQPQQPSQQPPQQPSTQQFQQQPLQPYPVQTPVPLAPVSPVLPSTGDVWTCPGCGNSSDAKFQFCMSCGLRRGNEDERH